MMQLITVLDTLLIRINNNNLESVVILFILCNIIYFK